MKKTFLLFLMLQVLAATTLFAQDDGRSGDIEGFVLDKNSHGIVGAEVTAFQPDRPSAGILPQVQSGVGGHFLMTGLWPPGLYQVTAQKPRGGYGNPAITLFASPSAEAPRVEVRPGETTKGVTVRLGPKGGWVTGVVVDASSGEEVRGARAVLFSANSSMEYWGGGLACQANIFLLLPSDKSVRVRISARGYETWYYGPDGIEAHATPIKMSPGETKEIIVRLHRLKGAAEETKSATCGDRVIRLLGR